MVSLQDIGCIVQMTKTYKHKYYFKAHGYTITMSDARVELKEWTKKQKQSMATVAGRLVRLWSRDVVKLAKMYAPEFDIKPYVPNPNSLVNSIKANSVVKSGSRYRVSLGVANTWDSGYEKWYADEHKGKLPSWGTSGKKVAILLHEFWDELAGTRALASAAAKSARVGAKVGEKFLTRALEDASQPNDLRIMAKAVVENAFKANNIVEF